MPNIIVCIKQVPDTEARIKINGDGSSIDESDINWIVSPYDEYALEAALTLKEAQGGEVTVLSAGPSRVQSTLRDALARGADKAVFVKDDGFGADPLSTAKILAAAVKDRGADLILFGKSASDDDSAAVGQMTAELLGLPAVSFVGEFTLDGTSGTAKRGIEGGTQVVSFSTPAVITCDKGPKEPRYANLKGIMAAKKKPLEEVAPAAAENKTNTAKLDPPPPRAAGKKVEGDADALAQAIVDYLKTEAKVL